MAASIGKLLSLTAMSCAMSLVAASVVAEQLEDPTRPAILSLPVLSGAGDSAPPAPVAQGLQSVIISHKRVAAIINGVEVEQGHKYGDAVLTEVNETCIVLMGPQGRRVMHMFPTVNLTKNEMACVRKTDMLPAKKVAGQAGASDPAAASGDTTTNTASKSKARVGNHKSTPVAVEDKDGSGK